MDEEDEDSSQRAAPSIVGLNSPRGVNTIWFGHPAPCCAVPLSVRASCHL